MLKNLLIEEEAQCSLYTGHLFLPTKLCITFRYHSKIFGYFFLILLELMLNMHEPTIIKNRDVPSSKAESYYPEFLTAYLSLF